MMNKKTLDEMEKTCEKIWDRYLKCKDYIDKKNMVSKSNLHWNMYLGEQWYQQGVDSANERTLPVVNFIEPIVNYKVSTLCKKSMRASFSDSEGRPELNEIYGMLNDNFINSWAKGKMDNAMWTHVKAAAVTGSSYLYFYGSDTSEVQVLPTVNVLLADELNPEIQEQPYIMIRERIFAKEVRKRAKLNGLPEDMWKDISGDSDDDYLTVNKDDVEHTGKDGKITSVIYFAKKDGKVMCARAVEGLCYEPMHEIKGLTKYPIVNFVWQEKPNSARGQGEVCKLVRNQVEVNKTYARRSVIVNLFAYPIRVYNSNMIENPDDLSKTGISIAVNGTADNVLKSVSYVTPPTMSPDAKNLSDDIMSSTRDLAGAGDTSMGQIDPTRVSGTAIVAIQEQAGLSLNEQLSSIKRCISDLAEVWLDMWICYNPMGLKVKRQATDEEKRMTDGLEYVSAVIPADELKRLKPEIKIDITENTQWAMNDRQTALDNLLNQQYITYEEYLEDLEDDGVLPKAKLQKQLKQRQAEMQAQQAEIQAQQLDQQAYQEAMQNVAFEEASKNVAMEEQQNIEKKNKVNQSPQ